MDHSIQAIQQFQNTVGKNAADSALIIDAMDLLHENKFQCFCIASSDSDFTRLSARLRESEIYVVGMGEQKTPISFRNACDKYLFLDLLAKESADIRQAAVTASEPEPEQEAEIKALPKAATVNNGGLDKQAVIIAIKDIVSQYSDDDGWFFLGELGNRLTSKLPDFDVRNFGFSKLTQFIKSLGNYEIKSATNPQAPSMRLVYIRDKTRD